MFVSDADRTLRPADTGWDCASSQPGGRVACARPPVPGVHTWYGDAHCFTFRARDHAAFECYRRRTDCEDRANEIEADRSRSEPRIVAVSLCTRWM
jgi:hypothetical protein